MSAAIEEYRKAQKSARRDFHEALSRGAYPYLHVLEDLTSNVEINSEVYLGLQDINLKQVVGTHSRGRSTSFASNFMPLLGEGTEFASKWINLCEAHLEEGIRDPIKVYEFLNRYYVVEGNKRVSVLKHFNAVSIPAQVTRLVPRANDTKESRVYREYLAFYQLCGVNYCIMSREGNYEKLLNRLHLKTSDAWTEDVKKLFLSVYMRFEKAYEELGGDKLSTTCGDALLEYLKFYSYKGAAHHAPEKLKRQLKHIWPEILKLEKTNTIDIVQDPTEKKNRLGHLNLTAPRHKLKVLFVHDRDPQTSLWTYGHEQGVQFLKTTMQDDLEIESVYNAVKEGENPRSFLEELAKNEYDVIFTTNPRLKEAALVTAAHYPKTKVLNCSINMAYQQIRTYYGRMYEAKFLCGLLAGCLTNNHRICYVASFSTKGLIANINGFARGVQMINPDAKIYLLWSTSKDKPWRDEIKRIQPDVVSSTQDMPFPSNNSEDYGLYTLDEEGKAKNVALPYWDWGEFYRRILESILSGSWNQDEEEGKSVNYWWGMSAGVIDLMLREERLPEGVCHLVKAFQHDLEARRVFPFDGVIKDQAGMVRSNQEGYVPTLDIINMDWLLDNVIGEIPAPEELDSRANAMIKAEEN